MLDDALLYEAFQCARDFIFEVCWIFSRDKVFYRINYSTARDRVFRRGFTQRISYKRLIAKFCQRFITRTVWDRNLKISDSCSLFDLGQRVRKINSSSSIDERIDKFFSKFF